jgi:predicted RNase H-like HicB family nuclease
MTRFRYTDTVPSAQLADMIAQRISVGLEEGDDGAALVHALSLPGCVSWGSTRDEALEAFPRALSLWLGMLRTGGEAVPPPDEELEVAVDEWVRTGAEVAGGESAAFFEADRAPLEEREIEVSLHRLGDLRSRVLARVRRMPDAELDRVGPGEWTARRLLDELARAQWWTLTRLGASPLAEVPERTVARLDTAMALVVQRFTAMPPADRGRVVEMDDETWSPRKVLRRLLWLEWSLGRAVLSLFPEAEQR